MKSLKKILAVLVATAMVAGMGIMAFAQTVSVTVDANGGKFVNGATTWTGNAEVESGSTVVNFGQLSGVPNVIAGDAAHAFAFWSSNKSGTSENLEASTSDPKFYAIWKASSGTGNKILDNRISVSGLDDGDKVKFYRVLEWDTGVDSRTVTGGWKAAAGFTGLTTAEIQKILGLDGSGTHVVNASNASQYGIDAALAAKIADMAESATMAYPASGDGIPSADGTAAVDNPEAGLYVAIITPGQTGVTYNPVFVGADYDGNTSNFHAIDLQPSYSPASLAKKSKITLNKTPFTEDQLAEAVATNDIITFNIETSIPVFADNYTEATFFVTDTLSDGLTLLPGTNNADIKVYKGWKSEGEGTDVLDASSQPKVRGTSGTVSNIYTITANGTKGFTVDFSTPYLLTGINASKKITITYSAQVTTDAPRSINLEDNTVEVHFSNSPTDGSGTGGLRDETKHYTFDIDANILGPNGDSSGSRLPWQTTEVVKVGLDENGNEITQTTTLHGVIDGGSGTTPQTIGALQGAKFKLYKLSPSGTTSIKNENGSNINVVPYTNKQFTSGTVIVSDGTGRLTVDSSGSMPGIRGLDLGTYYLVETEAPTGYIKEQNGVKIEIIAPKPDAPATSNEYWELKTYSGTMGGVVIDWNVWELKHYEVFMNGVKTADYTFTNARTADKNASGSYVTSGSVNKGDTIVGSDPLIGPSGTSGSYTGKIRNVQGVELPSTGGVGTTLFYAGGAILVLLAGVLLVSKRRFA